MLHRLALSLIVAAASLLVSRAAHAVPLVCADYLSGDYQPDELTSPASQSLADAARSCVCLDECAGVCSASDGEGGDACYLNAPGVFFDLGGDAIACEACGDSMCHAAINACVMDD